jgi:hypothetical protein
MTASTSESSTPVAAGRHPRRIDEIVLLALALLAGIGVAVNDYSSSAGFKYWMAMAPVFGLVSVLAAWARAGRRRDPILPVIRTQVLHWLGATGAVGLVYLLQTTGRMQNEAAGLTALVVLALACFTSGVHSDWRMLLLGCVLGLVAMGFAVLEEILWLLLLPALVVGTVAALIALRRRQARAAPGA